MSSAACPACGAVLEERRELGSITDADSAREHVRVECGGCRAILGRDYRLSPGGARAGRVADGVPTVIFTGASVVRALEPMEARGRSADRAGVLDELRSLQRDEEKQFLSATEAVQRHVRGIGLALARHAGLALRHRPGSAVGGPAASALFAEGTPQLHPVRLADDLALTDEQLESGGTLLPPVGVVHPIGTAREILLVLARSRLVADGAEPGRLRIRPPDPRPALRDWGSIGMLLVDLNLVSVA